MLLMLLCQKGHLLCVPYSPSYACNCQPWARVGCGEGRTPVCPTAWSCDACSPFAPSPAGLRLPSPRQVYVLEEEGDGHLINISAGLGVPFWTLLASVGKVCLPTASTSALSRALSSGCLWSSPSPVLFILSAALSFLFPCLSPFLFPLGLLFASALQVSCLPSKPTLPTAGISRYGMLIHFVLTLGALKPSDFMGLHKLETAVAQECTWK